MSLRRALELDPDHREATLGLARLLADRDELNILDPLFVVKATEHVPQMIALIERLIEKGHAYAAADGVYYDVATFPGYGTRLNAELPEERMAGARVEVNPNKRHPQDFALWRAAKPGDLQQWDSPWGRGNPGWHIECSAMSMEYLGETFDIHSGGQDHLFPHHECEIAQSEGATGKPFVRYWMHNRFLRVDSAKMAKSAGGFYQLGDIESWGFDPLAFRLLTLGTSYRKGVDFAREGRFVEAIADDFNTAKALAAAEDAVALLTSPEGADRARGLGLLFDMDRVFGLGLEAWTAQATALDDDVRALLDERAAARARGDYARSDQLRDELRRRGYLVKDTKEGQRWERIPPHKKEES